MAIITDVVNRHENLKQNFSKIEPVSLIKRPGFKGERTGQSLRDLNKAEIEPSDFTATPALTRSYFLFLVVIRYKTKQPHN